MRTARATAIEERLAQRVTCSGRFFEQHAEALARLCHAMAERFVGGGRLLAVGTTPAARTDAHHIAVEFVHPVIVGKRALPAIALTSGAVAELEQLAEPHDIVVAFGDDPVTARGVAAARARGCLTVGFADTGAAWVFVPETEDPAVAQEVVETAYHVLWELVHVFFEHRGLLAGRAPRASTAGGGAAGFLYPFLSESETDLDGVIDDVRRSVLMKAGDVAALRAQTLREGGPVLDAAADALRARLDAGGTLLALGNGGSATDAMDVVADFRVGSRPRRALNLAEDPSILTAIANDVGPELLFVRQVIAYGRAGDALIALSTSGGSVNVLDALVEARRRGLLTIALVGYDGGRVAAEGLADHVVVTRSQHIPRIQEAQASAYHVLRELVG